MYELSLPKKEQKRIFNIIRSFVGAVFEDPGFLESLESLILYHIADFMKRLYPSSLESITQLKQLLSLSNLSKSELPTSRFVELVDINKNTIRKHTKKDCNNQHDLCLFRNITSIKKIDLREMTLPGEMPGGIPTDF